MLEQEEVNISEEEIKKQAKRLINLHLSPKAAIITAKILAQETSRPIWYRVISYLEK